MKETEPAHYESLKVPEPTEGFPETIVTDWRYVAAFLIFLVFLLAVLITGLIIIA